MTTEDVCLAWGSEADKGRVVSLLAEIGSDTTCQRPCLSIALGPIVREYCLEREGRLLEWLVKPGDKVSRHTPVARLHPADAAHLRAIELTRTLSQHAKIAEATVLVRPYKDETHLVAYVCPRHGTSPETLWRELNEEYAQKNFHCLVLDRIPHNAKGQMDHAALATWPVPSEESLDRLEQFLVNRQEIEEAAVQLVPTPPPSPSRLHLHDLLPASQGKNEEETSQQQETPSLSSMPAISHGGPIPDQPLPFNLTELLARAAESSRDTGITYLEADEQTSHQTYAELYRHARSLAAGLSEIGSVGDPVLIQLNSRRAFLEGLWAVILAGMVPVPAAIAPLYQAQNQVAARLQSAWTLLEEPLILTDRTVSETIASFLPEARLQLIEELSGPASYQPHQAEPDALTLLLMTSGSTGKPKLVAHSHETLLPRGISMTSFLGLDATAVSLNWLPLDHVASIVDFHLRDLYLGCQQIQVATTLITARPTRWLDLIDEHRATVTWAPNFAYALIVDADLSTGNWDLSSMRHSIDAGEAIAGQTARRFLEVLAPFGYRADAVLPAWGMSETASGVTYAPEFDRDTPLGQFMNLGRPIPGFTLRIVNESGQIMHEGDIGRLQVKGTAVMTGYHGSPEQTRESITPEGWLNTGDLAMLREGCLYITGREKDVIIIRGLNYYSHEIEAVVEAIPGVQPSFTAACAVRDPRGSTDRLAIFFHPASQEEHTLAALISQIQAAVLQQVGLYPEYVLPLPRAEIPKTGIGKIQRARLRTAFEAGEFEARLRRLDLQQGNANTLPHMFHRRHWEPRPITGEMPKVAHLLLLCRGQQTPHEAALRAVLPKVTTLLWRDFDVTTLTHMTAGCDGILSLWQLGQRQEGEERAMLRATHQVLRASHQAKHVWLVASESQARTAGESLEPHRAATAAMVNVARAEYPKVGITHHDLGTALVDEEVAGILAALRQSSKEPERIWRKGRVHVPRYHKANLEPAKPLVRSGARLLISGGLGGIARHLAHHLIEHYDAQLYLLGRAPHSELSEEQARSLKDLETAGRVTYLHRLEDLPETPLDGIFHLAGLLREASIEEEAQLDAALEPKFDLLYRLTAHPATGQAFIVAFSTVISALGAANHLAYAVANRALEALTHELARTREAPVFTLAFSMWEDLGMSADYGMKDLTRALGYHLLTAEQGLQALQIASTQPGLTLIGLDETNPRLNHIVHGETRPALQLAAWYTERQALSAPLEALDPFGKPLPIVANPVERLPRDEVGKLDLAALLAPSEARPQSETQRRLIAQFRQVLGVPRVGVTDNFFQLGGHSILAVQLLERVYEAFGVRIEAPQFLAGPTVAQLAELIEAAQPEASETEEQRQIEPDPTNRHEPFPLTHIQQAYHIGRNADFELGDVSMHLYVELDMEDADHARLEQAWRAVIARHDMLRAVILPDGQERILPQVPPYKIELIDLRGEEREAKLTELRETLSHQKLPADRWPGFDLRLVRLTERTYRLFISMAAVHIDGGSFFLVMTELGKRYRNPDFMLPELALSYRDYALALHELEKGPAVQASLNWWRERLPELPPAPALPYTSDFARLRDYRFHHRGFRLDRETWSRIEAQAARLGISRSAMGLAVYGSVLSSWSRAAALTVNATLFNRLPLHPEVDQIAGDFTSMVLAALAVDAEDTVESLARRVQERLWQDLQHRGASGVSVLRELAKHRRQGSRALMPVVFTSALDLEMGGATSPDTALRALGPIHYQQSQTPQVILDTQFFVDEGELMCMMDSVDVAFPPDMPAHMLTTLERALLRLTEPSGWQEHPHLLPESQRVQRAAINDTAYSLTPAPMFDRFLEQASRHPQRSAVITSGRTLDYGEVAKSASRAAHWLYRHGAQPDTLVAVVMEKGWEQVVATVAVQMAGAAYLPMSPELPEERRDYLLAHGRVLLVVTTEAWAEKLDWPTDVTVLALDGPTLDQEPEQSRPVAVRPEQLAYVIFTSGSTGKPKGVMMEHGATHNTIADINSRFDVGPEDRIFALSELSFDLSVYDIFGALSAGAAIVMPDPGTSREPGHWLELAHREQITIWNSVPALMDMVATFAAGREQRIPGSLRLVLMSGDWIPTTLPERLREQVPELTIYSLGGATEAAIWSIYYPIETVPAHWKSIPYGKPMVNQTFHVLDHHLNPCPTWVPGALFIGGVGLARGYWRDELKTASSFIIHPRTGERLYRTGDLGRYLADGNIEFLGREDFQVKIQGHRIELGEIEAALMEHPAVDTAVVVAGGKDRHSRRLIGHVVLQEDDPADPNPVPRFVGGHEPIGAEALKAHLGEKLPAYMVPGNLVIHRALPLTPTGKVDRGALTQAADAEAEPERKGMVAPRTELERDLAAIWIQLLELPRVGIFDDLLQLGTNSLLAIKAVTAIREKLAVELPLRSVLSGSATLASLAAEIQSLRDSGNEARTQVVRAVPDPEHKHEPFHLNAIQEAYWIGRLDAFELGGVAAYFYLEVEVTELDLDRFRRAWQRVVDRHDMLRAIFLADGRQRILPETPPYQIQLTDLYEASESEAQEALATIRERMSSQVLPTDQWPLFELRATRLQNGDHRLHFGLDLLIADAWSVQILFGDMERFYREPELEVPPLALSFRDLLIAEARIEQGEQFQRSRAYWWDRLDSLPAPPDLPMVRELSDIDEPHFERRGGTLPPEHWQRLSQMALDKGLSPSGLLLAAFAEVLGYWSRTRHFTLNVTTFNRPPLHELAEHVVGDFTSLNLLEVKGEANSFDGRARAVQEQLWRDLEHRDGGGIPVLRELSRRQGRTPGALAPIVFTSLLDSYGKSGDFVPLGGEVVFATSQTPQVWLDYQVREQDGTLYMTWDIIADLLPPHLPGQLFAAYHQLLTHLAEDEKTWFAPHLDLLPEAQRTVRAGINATEREFPTTLMHTPILERAAAEPDAVAAIGPGFSLHYGELRDRVLRLAAHLRGLGAKPNELVAIVLPKSPHQAVATLAIQAAGAAYLPISTAWPESRRDYLLDNGNCRIVLTDSQLLRELTWPDHITVLAVDGTLVEEGEVHDLEPRQQRDDLAYVIFTSGSTGKPKGVMIEHGAVVNTLYDINSRFKVNREDRVFALSALNFDLSVYDVFGALQVGAAIVYPSPDANRDPQQWLELCAAHRVSIWNSVPALVDMLVTHATGTSQRLPDSLRLVLMSGDWIPVSLPARLRKIAREPNLISMGGATEASIWSIIYPIGLVPPHWASIPYGKPMANQRFHVLGPDLEPRPVWVPGSLYIGGVGLARGYWRDEKKTAAAFITHPGTGERLYRTGDMGRYLPGGNIEFLGREDFQVKIQGYRIELGEIENAMNQHPDVDQAVVIAHGKDRHSLRLVGYVVPTGETLDVDELRHWMTGELPDYMVPGVVIPLAYMPLTANGKVDRKALPEPDSQIVEERIAEPESPLQRELAALWRELLELERIDLHGHFFELGGNSLMAIRMISAVGNQFGVAVTLRDFFDAPTVAGLADLVARLRAQTGDSLASPGMDLPELVAQPERHLEPFALNDIQQAYWMGRVQGLELGGVAAHFYFELELTTVHVDRVENAWRRLIERHDMLRVVFRPDGRQQVLREVPPFEVKRHDHRQAETAAAESALQQLRDELSHQVLPTDRWPLFEIHASLLPRQLVRLHFSFDLLLADAWSAQLLFQDFTRLFGEPDAELEPLELTFRDYLTAMERLPETATYERAKSYWQRRLPSLPPAPELPLLMDPNAMRTVRFERRAGSLPRLIWERLQERAARAGLTPSGLVLAVFSDVLARYSTRPRFTINVTTFNRVPIHDQIEQLVGDFTSLTLLAVSRGGGNFEQRARAVQEQLWEDLDHRFYSGIQVLRELATYHGRPPGALMPVVFTSRLFKAQGGASLPGNDDGTPGAVIYSVSQTPQVWLDKQVFEENGNLAWTWDSVAGLFPHGLVDQMFTTFEACLHQLAKMEHSWHASDLVGMEQLHALVARVNDTAAPLPLKPLTAAILDAAEAHAARPALITAQTTMDYATLMDKARAVAQWLREGGAGPERFVAIIMDKGIEQVIAALAVHLAGAAYLPIDPHWPADRRDYVLEKGEVSQTLSTSHHLESLAGRKLAVDQMTDDAPRLDEPMGNDLNHLAYAIFTSGSTGKPKGVAIEHGAAANTIADINSRFGVGPEDRCLAVSNLSFDLSVYDLFGLLAVGGAVVLPESKTNPDPESWLALTQTHDVTLWNSVPALFELLLACAETDAKGLPDRFRLVLLSGDWLPLDIAPRLQALVPNARMISLGGATEGSIWSIHYPITRVEPHWTSIPYGTALANQQMYVLDHHLRPSPIHVPGHIHIGGAGVAREYLGDPTRTAAAYIPSPLGNGARLYRTGDLGRTMPDGNIEFLGRADFQVKVQGHRIELGEIEAALLRIEGIDAAAVEAPWADQRRGPGGTRRLVAYLVGKAIPESDDLKSVLAEQLPEYMVPGIYIMLEQMPLSANGKVDRRALPKPDIGTAHEALTPPATTMEARLAAIWKDVLKVSDVGRESNFFDLGGNSLLALELLRSLRDLLDVPVALQDLFDNLSLAQLAETVERLQQQGGSVAAESWTSIDPDLAHRHDPFPLTDVQQAYWIGRMEGIQGGSVAAHAYYELESANFDLERFQAGFRALIDRHDALRIIIDSSGMQRILAEVPPYHIAVEDLREEGERRRLDRLTATRERMSHQILPADVWPIFEVRATLLPDGITRLHLSFDLLISDAWSSQVLFHELALYLRGRQEEWEPLRVSFRDYVMAERALHGGERYQRSHDYWMTRLQTLPPGPELPLAKQPEEIGTPTYTRLDDSLDGVTWQALKARATDANLSPSGLLLGAFSEVLAHWSARDSFTLNLTTFNRLPLHPQVNNLMGDFTSLTLLQVDGVRGDFANRCRAIQERLWKDLDHRHMNGVEVMREMVRARGGGMAPRAPVVFTSRLFSDGNFVGAEEKSDLFGNVIYSVSQTPQVWLDHQVLEEDGALSWTWDAVAGLFPEGLVEAMFATYAELLRDLAHNDALWREEIVLAEPMPQPPSDAEAPRGLIHEPVLAAAKRWGDRPAVISSQKILTHAELQAAAYRVGRHLRKRGAQPETLVAIVMEKGWQQVVAALAVNVAGAAYLPIDVNLPADRIAYILEKGQVSHILTQRAHCDHPSFEEREVHDTDALAFDDTLDASPLTSVQQPDQLAYVIFTSGSTGQPKGVAIEHAAALNTIVDVNARWRVDEHDRVLAISSLSFDLSVYDIYGPLARGGALVLPDPGNERNPAHWAELMHTHRVTIWNSVPALLDMMVEAGANTVDPRGRLPQSLRLVLMSGDWIPTSLPDRIRAQVPSISINSLGGATEASIWSITYPIEAVQPNWPSIPYGQGMVHQRFYVLDEHLQPRPAWVPGELYIGGVGLAREYWDEPEKTAAAFITHPETGERLYRTGDHGRLLGSGDGREGHIEFLGRQDQQVKILGYRVELGEIEAALTEHPAVATAVVNAPFVDGGQQGSGRHRRLIAYVVPEKDAPLPSIDPDEIHETVCLPKATAEDTQPESGTLDEQGLLSLLATLRQIQPAGLAVPKYRYPSGGGLYPVQVYLSLGKPLGQIAAGIYAYHPQKHALLALAEPAPNTESFAIHLVGRQNAIGPLYPTLGRQFCLLEAGYMHYLLDHAANAKGIQLYQQGSNAYSAIAELLPLQEGDVWCTSLGLKPETKLVRPQLEPAIDWQARAVKDPVERLTFKMKQLGLPQVADAEVVELPGPSAEELARDFAARRSARSFQNESITLEHFGPWLANLASETEMSIYLQLKPNAVQGLRAGGWHYQADKHQLHLLAPDADFPRAVHGPINRPIYDTAGFTIFLMNRGEPSEAQNLRAGYLGQLLQEEGIAQRIGICPLGGLELAPLRAMFGLSEEYQLVHMFIGGSIPEEPVGLQEALDEQQAIQRKMMAEFASEQKQAEALAAGPLASAMDHGLDAEQMKAHLAERLPAYMVPGTWLFLERLPLTANGKVDRKALPQPDERPAGQSGGEPRDQLEQTIVETISTILGLDKVGTLDNFFELGANSLQLVHLQGQLQEHLKREVPITAIFGNPTVVALATTLRGNDEDALEEGRDRARKRRARRAPRGRKERKP